ncbi:MAG: ABC transporter permease [Firmicutes bacterium]|jgi:peptide/nickel transport system permease protein|nr:ABC transporter permease [Bacillota bacterium]MDD4336858.1 ABC transporter permease [Bacillota bacterium]MDD4793044.1 ABC transporter permease [Bacillota bacterium]
MIRLTRTQVKIAERILATIPLALGVAIVAFVFMRAMPGDPVDIMMGEGAWTSEEEMAALRDEMGLDEPIHAQLWAYLKRVLAGDLGYSMIRSRPVAEIIREALPATIELAVFSLLFALAVGIPVGVASALKPNSFVDRAGASLSLLGVSLPAFWLGIVGVLIFSMTLGWLPTSGRIAYDAQPAHITGMVILDAIITGNLPALGNALKHICLPAVTLGLGVAAVVARVTRSSMLDVISADYIQFARAKGVPEGEVTRRHALRNAMIPTVTLVGLQFGSLLGGNMIVETIFGWPGLGRVVVDSIFARDYPVVQASVMVYALTFVLINLATDIIYTVLDPKISL